MNYDLKMTSREMDFFLLTKTTQAKISFVFLYDKELVH